jgi:hypothetical protein
MKDKTTKPKGSDKEPIKDDIFSMMDFFNPKNIENEINKINDLYKITHDIK